MNRFGLLVAAVFILFALSTPAFSLTLQEKMELIKQKEMQRKEQIRKEYDKKNESQQAASDKEKPQPQPVAPVVRRGVPEAAGDQNKDDKEVVIEALVPEQVWEYLAPRSPENWTHRLFINTIEGDKITSFYTITSSRGAFNAYLLEGNYNSENNEIDLKYVDKITGRRSKYELTGKILNGNLVASVQNDKKIKSYTYKHKKEKNSNLDETFYFCKTFYKKREIEKVQQEKQLEVKKHYQELVIIPEYDEYGIKTEETMKLEVEKKFLRPLTEKEIEEVKQFHAKEVQSAINRKKQQEEQTRLAAEQKRIAEEAKSKRQAEIQKREKEPLVIFDSLDVADAELERDDVRELITKAGGQYIDPQQLKEKTLGLMSVDDPNMDLFDTSKLLPGASMGVAVFISEEGMFGSDDYLVSFSYTLDTRQVFNHYRTQLKEKYGPPSVEEKNNMGWSRASGQARILLMEQKTGEGLFTLSTYTLAFLNVENFEKIEKAKKSLEKKQKNNF